MRHKRIIPLHRVKKTNKTTSTETKQKLTNAANATPVVSMRMSTDIRDQLRQMAEADNRSLNNYVLNVLRKHISTKTGKAV